MTDPNEAQSFDGELSEIVRNVRRERHNTEHLAGARLRDQIAALKAALATREVESARELAPLRRAFEAAQRVCDVAQASLEARRRENQGAEVELRNRITELTAELNRPAQRRTDSVKQWAVPADVAASGARTREQEQALAEREAAAAAAEREEMRRRG